MSRPFTLARTDTRTVDAGGRSYDVVVALPAEPPPPAGYPAIYVLDPHVAFATTVESLRARTPRAAATGVSPTVVIGIGYPTADLQDRGRRMFDCTPAGVEPADPEAVRDGFPHGVGGAERFLHAIREHITPSVERDFPLNPDTRMLLGHSLSGLFVVHTLLTEPAAFRTFVAASPSLWWAPDHALALAQSLAARLPAGRPTQVLLTVGEYEQALAPWQHGPGSEAAAARRASRRMVDRVMEMGRLLEAAGDGHLRVECVTLPGEDHASVLPLTIGRALKFGKQTPT